MNPLFDYLLKSVLWLCSFYVVYHYLLRKETFCNFNRIFLLTGIFASIIMPLIVVYHTVYTTVSIEEPLPVVTTIPTIRAEQTVSLREIIQNTAVILYGSCLLFFIIRTVVNLAPLLKEIRKHKGDNKLIYTRTFSSPFSFGKYIFIPESISDQERELILTHEYTHTKEFHYLDLWMIKAICILQFFNPVAWLYTKAVQENCEFIADHHAFRNTTLKEEYLQLLIKYSVGNHLNSTTLHFSFPLIFKRIKIMKQKQSNKLASLKSLMIVPLACIIIVGFAQTKVVENKPLQVQKAVVTSKSSAPQKNQTKNLSKENVANGTSSKNGTAAKTQLNQTDNQANTQDEVVVVGYGSGDENTISKNTEENNDVFIIAEEMPIFQKGGENASSYFAKNIRYPAEAQRKNIQGRVICQFIVEKDGSISSVQVVRGIDPLLDAEACRVIYSMPKWTPGKQRGQIVRVKYTIPINFKLNK